ncbi:hypothetical protein HZB02_02415 [Candidatus Woesearchaeota archaeon]|nr:hypothetical protein [Candidatus Woesearchaeota archaeon]
MIPSSARKHLHDIFMKDHAEVEEVIAAYHAKDLDRLSFSLKAIRPCTEPVSLEGITASLLYGRIKNHASSSAGMLQRLDFTEGLLYQHVVDYLPWATTAGKVPAKDAIMLEALLFDAAASSYAAFIKEAERILQEGGLHDARSFPLDDAVSWCYTFAQRLSSAKKESDHRKPTTKQQQTYRTNPTVELAADLFIGLLTTQEAVSLVGSLPEKQDAKRLLLFDALFSYLRQEAPQIYSYIDHTLRNAGLYSSADPASIRKNVPLFVPSLLSSLQESLHSPHLPARELQLLAPLQVMHSALVDLQQKTKKEIESMYSDISSGKIPYEDIIAMPQKRSIDLFISAYAQGDIHLAMTGSALYCLLVEGTSDDPQLCDGLVKSATDYCRRTAQTVPILFNGSISEESVGKLANHLEMLSSMNKFTALSSVSDAHAEVFLKERHAANVAVDEQKKKIIDLIFPTHHAAEGYSRRGCHNYADWKMQNDFMSNTLPFLKSPSVVSTYARLIDDEVIEFEPGAWLIPPMTDLETKIANLEVVAQEINDNLSAYASSSADRRHHLQETEQGITALLKQLLTVSYGDASRVCDVQKILQDGLAYLHSCVSDEGSPEYESAKNAIYAGVILADQRKNEILSEAAVEVQRIRESLIPYGLYSQEADALREERMLLDDIASAYAALDASSGQQELLSTTISQVESLSELIQKTVSQRSDLLMEVQLHLKPIATRIKSLAKHKQNYATLSQIAYQYRKLVEVESRVPRCLEHDQQLRQTYNQIIEQIADTRQTAEQRLGEMEARVSSSLQSLRGGLEELHGNFELGSYMTLRDSFSEQQKLYGVLQQARGGHS